MPNIHKVVNFVSKHVTKVTGLNFAEKDLQAFEARIRRRSAGLGLLDLNQYEKYLENNLDHETTHLISLLTTHHTAFFREFVHFEELERSLLPVILQESQKNEITLWSAAASMGQEAYSLSMFLYECALKLNNLKYRILATDIDEKSLAHGKNGVYLAREVNQSPAIFLKSHWAKGTGEISQWVKAKPSVKSPIEFQVNNLLQPHSFLKDRKFDIVFCRNVFLYFNPEQIQQAVRTLLSHLHPWGAIVIGVCENFGSLNLPLVNLGHSIFVPLNSPHLIKKQISKTGRTNTQAIGQNVISLATKTPSKVIVVDDSATVLALMKKILTTQNGFEVVATAKNLTEARQAVASTKADIMTLDLHLGKETGLEYLQSINGKPHIPVVLVSALNRDQEELAKSAIQLGAADYVEKPEGTNLAKMGEELCSKLNTVLRTQNKAQAARTDIGAVRKVKVLIVDDSATMLKVLAQMIGSHPDIEVVGCVQDPREIERQIRNLKPQVMTLDMNMPGLTGVDVLKRLPEELRIPTIVVSSLTMAQGSLVLQAMQEGAIDYFQKPELLETAQQGPILQEKIIVAAKVTHRKISKRQISARSPTSTSGFDRQIALRNALENQTIIGLGASTGGTEAIRVFLEQIPKDIPPICIVQHIPPVFSAAFAQRLAQVCQRPVVEVTQGEALQWGKVYIAPGDQHFTVKKTSTGFVAELLNSPKHSGHRPSVDVLFQSLANLRAINLFGLLLTGMGRDGAEGLRQMRLNGARTVCQSESSCVVFGMPRVGIELGAAEFVEDLENMAPRLHELLAQCATKRQRA